MRGRLISWIRETSVRASMNLAAGQRAHGHS